MLATRKDKSEAAGRRNLRVRLALERITGRSQERDYVSGSMQDGIDREPDAIVTYEAMTGRLLTPVGFVVHDSLMAGCSPDGVIGDFEGIVEIKSPIAATHLDYIKSGVVPLEYARQIQHHLWLTGAKWCDWLSFNPDFPEQLQVKLVRVEMSEQERRSYEFLVNAFLNEVSAEVEAVQALMAVPA